MPAQEFVLETPRLLLRPWRIAEAGIQQALWTERDPRVPAHRRIGADGSPTIADIEGWIRGATTTDVGLLAMERKDFADVIGYCGLVDSGRGAAGEPEIAFEVLRRTWGQGYATEAALAVRATRVTLASGPRSGTGTRPRSACSRSSGSRARIAGRRTPPLERPCS